MDIKESMDVVKYAQELTRKLKEEKLDDGKLDTSEVVKSVTSTLPAGVKAMIGSGKIKDELDDLDDEERDQLLKATMEVVDNVVAMFMPQDEES